jgi:phosphate transport system ATP-binding protein
MEEKINGMIQTMAKENNQNKACIEHPEDTKGILEVQNLNAWYGKTLAIKNISMSIPSKAIMAIIGPSGCGKSTFIRCLNRMHEVSHGGRVEGCIMLDGKDIYARDADPVVI